MRKLRSAKASPTPPRRNLIAAPHALRRAMTIISRAELYLTFAHAARLYRRARRARGSALRLGQRSDDPSSDNRQRDRADQQEAEDDADHDARHVDQRQAERHQAEHEHRDDDAGDRAGTAGDGDAAEDYHGDDFKLPAERDIGPRRSDPRGEENGGDAGKEAGQNEQAEFDALDRNAGKSRRDRIGDHRVKLSPERRAMEHESEDHRENQEQRKGIMQRRMFDEIILAQCFKALGIFGNRLVAEHDLGDAAKQRHRADGDDDRRQADARDEKTVEGAADRADDKADEDERDSAGAGLRGEAHRQRAERDDRGDRKVDFAHQDQQRHAERDDRFLGEIGGGVGEIVDVEKIGRQKRIADEHQDQQAEQNGLPAQQEIAGPPARFVGDLGAGFLAHLAAPALRRASRRMSLPPRRSTRALTITAARMTAPDIAICQNGVTCMTGSALTMTPRNRAPSRAPATVPTPPAIETPPITQAAITVNS